MASENKVAWPRPSFSAVDIRPGSRLTDWEESSLSLRHLRVSVVLFRDVHAVSPLLLIRVEKYPCRSPFTTTSTQEEDGMATRAVGKLLRRVLMVPPQHFSVEVCGEKRDCSTRSTPGWGESSTSRGPSSSGRPSSSPSRPPASRLPHSIRLDHLQVLTLDQKKGLPDMVFVCNSGLVLGDAVYVSRFRHKERSVGEHVASCIRPLRGSNVHPKGHFLGMAVLQDGRAGGVSALVQGQRLQGARR